MNKTTFWLGGVALCCSGQATESQENLAVLTSDSLSDPGTLLSFSSADQKQLSKGDLDMDLEKEKEKQKGVTDLFEDSPSSFEQESEEAKSPVLNSEDSEKDSMAGSRSISPPSTTSPRHCLTRMKN
jgi:hypothetical protein